MTNIDREPGEELTTAVKEAVEATTGVDFEVFFSTYLVKMKTSPILARLI